MKKIIKFIFVLILLVFFISGCVAQQSREYTSLEAIAKYLSETDGGSNENNPLSLRLSIDLQNMLADESGWKKLLKIINTQGKYVALDLSNCKMSGTEFNPDVKFEDGKKFIISIILPDVTESIVEANIELDRRGRVSSPSTFQYFSKLELSIPSKVTFIGYPIFTYCSNIASISFKKGSQLEGIDWSAFSDSKLVTITIPASVTYIDQGAFSGCKNLINVIFEHGSLLNKVGVQAFAFCDNLETITIPSSVSFIEDMAFEDCSNLKSITIFAVDPPALGHGAFSTFQVLSGSIYTGSVSGVYNKTPALEAIYVPSESVSAYKSAENWSDYAEIIKPIIK